MIKICLRDRCEPIITNPDEMDYYQLLDYALDLVNNNSHIRLNINRPRKWGKTSWCASLSTTLLNAGKRITYISRDNPTVVNFIREYPDVCEYRDFYITFRTRYMNAIRGTLADLVILDDVQLDLEQERVLCVYPKIIRIGTSKDIV